MQFYTKQHKFYCGIDLHTKKMYVCILDEQGEVREHRDMDTDPDAFLEAIAPFREDTVVAVECMFTWYWIADLCQKEGIPFVLGHALYMKAIHGGKAKNDKIDSKKNRSTLTERHCKGWAIIIRSYTHQISTFQQRPIPRAAPWTS
jgi:transposase